MKLTIKLVLSVSLLLSIASQSVYGYSMRQFTFPWFPSYLQPNKIDKLNTSHADANKARPPAVVAHAQPDKAVPPAAVIHTQPDKAFLPAAVEHADDEEESPPPGFENIKTLQTTYVDGYFMGNYVTPVMISYTEHTVTIHNPKIIVQDLPDISDAKKIIQALSGTIASHANQACSDPQAKLPCNVLQPKVASVIFDIKHLRLFIFVNPKFLPTAVQTKHRYLPTPNATTSYINSLSVISSATNNLLTYTLNSNSILAHKAMDFSFDANYSGVRRLNTETPLNDPNTFMLQNILGTYAKSGKLFQAGMITTEGGNFLSNQFILGAAIKTQLNQLQNEKQIRGLSLEIYLPTPSLVSVFQDGRLIGSGSYPAGNQFLDTQSFPEGAYNVVIKITDTSGNVREITRFYVKNTTIPPLGHPQYYLSLGKLQQPIQNTETVLPDIANIPIYQLGYAKRLTPNLAFSENLLGSNKVSTLESNLTFLLHYISFTASGLYATDNDWGLGGYSQIIWKTFVAQLRVTKIFGHIDTLEQAEQDNVFDPITTNSLQSSLSLSQDLFTGNINASYNRSESADNTIDNSYNIGYQFPFKLFKSLQSRLQVSYQEDNDDRLIYLTLTLSLQHNNWSHYVTNSLQHYLNQPTDNQPTNDYNINYQAAWQKQKLGMYRQNASIDLTHDDSYNSANASYKIDSNNGYLSTSIRHNAPKNIPQNTQFTLTAHTGLVFKPGRFSISNTSLGTTGFLIDVESPNANDKFQVLINGRPVNIIDSNDPTFIYAPPYKSYRVSISSINKTLYALDTKPRQVTLYENNVQYLQWKATEKYVLIAQLIYPDNKPLGLASVEGGVGVNQTDEQGFMHAELLENIKKLIIKPLKGKSCEIDLSHIKPENGFYYQEKMLCKPLSK